MKLLQQFEQISVSHRLDADSIWKYFEIRDIETDQIVAPSRFVRWRDVDHDFFDRKLFQLTKRKRKMLIGAISHCNADSNRDILIKKLQKYTQFDLFGRCTHKMYQIL